jgi:hypothetical protein
MNHFRPDVLGNDGRIRCRAAQTRLKVVYESIDAAWLTAWRVFIERGHLLTPYRCAPYRFEYRVESGVRCIAHPGCNRWHLARTEHVMMLPGSTS